MEAELRNILLSTANAYATAADCGITTVARRVKNNAGFFKGIANPSKSFTARTFDEVMRWFAKNWPDGKERPFELMKFMRESGDRKLRVSA